MHHRRPSSGRGTRWTAVRGHAPAVLLLAAAALLGACADQEPTAPLTVDESLAAVQAPATTPEFVPGHVLARFSPGASAASVARGHGATAQRELFDRIWVLNVPAGREHALADALSRNPNVEFAEPDYLRTFGNPCETTGCIAVNDVLFGYKWDLHNDGTINSSSGAVVATTGAVDADIDWLEVYDQLGGNLTGSAVIGILDTGVFGAHPDLAGKVLSGYDFVNGDNDPADDHGHGTHVAGIAAAHGGNGQGVTGVAWGGNVKILPVKVCGPSGCPTSAIVDGIVYAADNGANVINLSLGGRFGSSSEQVALQYALSRDVLPFCATGNDRARSVSYPAAFPECVAVAATDWGDNRASYSNRGPEVELAAPGGDSENQSGYSYIASTSYDGGYVLMAGTSMATPQAVGLAALLHAQGITGADAIRTRLQATADDLGSAGRDSDFGFGRINAYSALNNITDGGGSGGGGGGNGGGNDGCKGGPKKCP